MASRSWNRVELMGNLTRDPELRYTPNGASVCTFGIATNRSYLVEGERKEEVDFHNLVAWNKLAELCNQLLKKGSRVFVSGRLQYREWDGQDGQKRRVAEIVIEDMIQLTPKAEYSSGGDQSYSQIVEASGLNAAPASEKAVSQAKETVSTPAPQAPAPAPAAPAEDTPPPAAPANEDVSSDDLPF